MSPRSTSGTGRDPARHPEDQEPHSFGAHRGTMVALPVIDLGPATSTTTLGYALHFLPAGFRHTTGATDPDRSRKAAIGPAARGAPFNAFRLARQLAHTAVDR